MKVMLVNGSPHEDGCTHAALSVLKETLELFVRKYNPNAIPKED